jgi:REP element-mobilizing transposase RayT
LDDADCRQYLTQLQSARDRFGFTLYAYVLMPNHVHLLLETGDVILSRIMLWLGTTYARYFNRRYGKIGHLFQGRYKTILCDKDAYLLALVRYLHLNPVRAGIVGDPEEYPWSSHRAYLGLTRDMGMPRAIILGQFGLQPSRAVAAYREYVSHGIGEGHQPKYYQVVDQRYLGSSEFVAHVQERTREAVTPQRRTLRLSLRDLVERVGQCLGVNARDLKSASKVPRLVEARDVLAYIAREYAVGQGVELARILSVDPTVISRGAGRVAKRLAKERRLASRVGELVRRLAVE